jgi:hypothetical protein
MTILQQTAADEDAATIRRRKATSAMCYMIRMHSPPQAHFHAECCRQEELLHRLHILHQCGEDSSAISNELDLCHNRMMSLISLIDFQWKGLLGVDDEP